MITGSYCGAETGIFGENWVNSTVADDLAPCVARLSATMDLTTQAKRVRKFLYYDELFQSRRCWETIEDTNVLLYYPEYTPHDKVNPSPSGAAYLCQLTQHPLDKMAAILADDIFKSIFVKEYDRIQIHISLKFVPKSPIDNKPALIQVMAWRRTDPQAFTWTNDDPVHWRIYAAPGGDELTGLVLVQVMTCRLFDARPLPKPPMLAHCKLTLRNKLKWNSNKNTKSFIDENVFEMSSVKLPPLCPQGDEWNRITSEVSINRWQLLQRLWCIMGMCICLSWVINPYYRPLKSNLIVLFVFFGNISCTNNKQMCNYDWV